MADERLAGTAAAQRRLLICGAATEAFRLEIDVCFIPAAEGRRKRAAQTEADVIAMLEAAFVDRRLV